MSLSNIKQILVRASTDANFRKTLLEDPGAIFKKYELTQEEQQCLRELESEDQLEACCETHLKSSDFLVSDIRI